MTWDVLLVLLNPHKTLRLAGQEHGRAIPLGDICNAAYGSYSTTSSAQATSIGGERERELIDRLTPPAPYGCLRFQVFRPVFGPELSGLPPSLLPLLLGEVGWWRGASINWITNSHEEFFLSRRRAHAKHSRCATGDILEEVRRICRDVNCRASVYNRFLAAEGEF